MKLIADLHLHSKYSRAVSKQMIIPEIANWAKIKGIDLVGAPDWTHPLFFRELKRDLIETGEGIFAYKEDPDGPKFLLITEISSIYSQAGKGRRIHNLILAPSFEVAEKINTALKNKGANLLSDGRPIIGLSAQDLAELAFSINKNCLIIPCHIWTPWFSLYGSRSGFDSVKECFGEFSDQIYAVETGLSSDPAMNWRIKELDSKNIVSFSDAHSPAKLGREATVFEIKDKDRVISYQDIRQAIIGNQDSSNLESQLSISYTIEFYPEEGKYHFTGHRKCGVKHSPEESKKLGKTCPVCGRELTVGVMHRVEELATRSIEEVKTHGQNRPPYKMLVPLLEILAEVKGVGVSSKAVQEEYLRLTNTLESEFSVLLKAPPEEIAKVSGEKTAEGILRVRSGQVFIDPGYDGVFGKVKIWPQEEVKEEKKQMSLF